MGDRRDWIRRALDTSERSSGEPAPPQAASARPEATVAPGCELEGQLKVEGPLTVYGDFTGSIECSDDVVVAPEGTVQGPIQARSVVVQGSVVGDLAARREVVLQEGGKLHGDVKSPSLVIERGACFEGRSERVSPIAPRGEPKPRRPGLGSAAPTA
jgi:cytoskeletal protein CcmA (bactofilin family)